MKLTPRSVAIEARLLLIGIPVLLWTLIPIYHLVLFAISDARHGHLRPALAGAPDAAELRHRVRARSTSTSTTSGSSSGTRC